MTEPISLCPAVVGLGSMGLGIAASLARAGAKVAGCDINPDALAELAKFGRAAENPAQAAARRHGPGQRRRERKARPGTSCLATKARPKPWPPGALVMSCATMSPQDAREIWRGLRGAGAGSISTPPIRGGAAKAADRRADRHGFRLAGGLRRSPEPLLKATAGKVFGLGRRTRPLVLLQARQSIARRRGYSPPPARLWCSPSRWASTHRSVYEVITDLGRQFLDV